MSHFHRPNCPSVLHFARELIIIIPLLALTMNFPAVAEAPERVAQVTNETQSVIQPPKQTKNFVDHVNELLGIKAQKPSA